MNTPSLSAAFSKSDAVRMYDVRVFVFRIRAYDAFIQSNNGRETVKRIAGIKNVENCVKSFIDWMTMDRFSKQTIDFMTMKKNIIQRKS